MASITEMPSNFISLIYVQILPISIEHISFISFYQNTRPAEDTENQDKMKYWCLRYIRWKETWCHMKNNVFTEKEGQHL